MADVVPIIERGGILEIEPFKNDGNNNTIWGLPNASTLKAEKKVGKKAPRKTRELYELSDPDRQCLGAIGAVTRSSRKPICYICGYPIKNTEDSGFNATEFYTTGRQCEHVIPVLTMAILSGLYSPTASAQKISSDIATTTFFKNNKSLIRNKWNTEYIKWQKNMFQVSYQWSHTECNMIKNEFPFINVTIDISQPNPIIISAKHHEQYRNNIKQLLIRLLQDNSKWANMWRTHYTKEANKDITKYNNNITRWLDIVVNNCWERYILPIIKLLQLAKPILFCISIGILKQQIMTQLQRLDKLLDKSSIIAELFKYSKESIVASKKPASKASKKPASKAASTAVKKTIDDKYSTLTIKNIRLLLANMDIKPAAKTKKADLIKLLIENESLAGLKWTKEEMDVARTMIDLSNEPAMEANIKSFVQSTKLVDPEEGEDEEDSIVTAIYLLYLKDESLSDIIEILNGNRDRPEYKQLIEFVKSSYNDIDNFYDVDLSSFNPVSYIQEAATTISELSNIEGGPGGSSNNKEYLDVLAIELSHIYNFVPRRVSSRSVRGQIKFRKKSQGKKKRKRGKTKTKRKKKNKRTKRKSTK